MRREDVCVQEGRFREPLAEVADDEGAAATATCEEKDSTVDENASPSAVEVGAEVSEVAVVTAAVELVVS